MLLEELVPMGTLLTRSDMHVRPPALQLMEPDQELHEMPPAEPQEMNIDEEEEEEKCGPFLDIGKAKEPLPPALGFFLRAQVLSWLWVRVELLVPLTK